MSDDQRSSTAEREAAKLGFKRFIIPEGNRDDVDVKKYDVFCVKTIKEAIEKAFKT